MLVHVVLDLRVPATEQRERVSQVGIDKLIDLRAQTRCFGPGLIRLVSGGREFDTLQTQFVADLARLRCATTNACVMSSARIARMRRKLQPVRAAMSWAVIPAAVSPATSQARS